MSSGYQEPGGGTASPSTGTAVGSKPIRAWLKVLRNVDITSEPGYGSTFIPKIQTPFEIKGTSLRIQNPAQTFYTNIESAALLANQSIKVPIITATESGNKKDEVVLLKQGQSLENKTFPTYFDVTETAAPASPSAGTLRIYANSTTHELTQRNSSGTEVKLSDGTGGGGGGGAPTDAQYLTLGVNATLTGERVLTGSGRISITDAGPGVTATLDIPTGAIVDSYIGSHTSTKISITAKGQLNSNIVYTDQTNTMGDFDQVFRDNRLRINNPADTFSYTLIAAAIGANRNLTLPLLTGNDTAVTEAFSQTLTNKTISGSSNTISNIGDGEIASHTSTKISITTKGQLNSSIAYVDQANVFSDNDQSFRSARLRVANPANTFFYNFTAAAIAANRIINLPLLTGTDTMVTEAFSQTLTNKTINASNNTVTNIGDSAIAAHTSTKVTITTKGQLNSNILYGDQNNTFGAFYHDITEIAAPANPSAGTLRIYANSTTHELTQRDSSGTERKFSDGSGGAGAPTNVPYLTLASDATLTTERVATASSRVTITDGGANSTATFDIGSGSIVDAYIGSHTSTKISITNKGQLNSSIVYTDQANSFGDFAQTFKDNQLKINNPADTFAYTLVGAAIAANRNVTLPLLTGNDTVVTEAFAQTLTNKTIAAGSNTVSGIVDANIDAHTSSKITITTKGQLNSSIAYIDQANVFSDNDQSFRSNRLRIANPANTFFYSFTGAAIAASRIITLPLLTAGDTMVTEAFAQTLTNKTIAAGSNTISGIVDANIGSHTSSKITITTKGQLNSSIVYTDQANTFGAFDQTFPTSRLLLGDSDASHAYIFAGSNLATNRTVTWPLLTGNDIPVLEAHSQTLTNKTINFSNNTGSNIGDSAIAAHTSTKITITTKGQLNSAILYNDVDNALGAHYVDIDEIAAPGNPSAGKLRVWADSTTHEISQKNSSGTVVKMSDGSGGAGFTGQITYSYIIYKEGSDYIAYNTITNTEQFTNTTAHTTFNSVIDAMNTAGGGKAFVKNGLYLFTGPMIPEHFAGLVGESNDKTIFRHTTNAADSSMFRYWQGASSTLLESFSLENISIEINNLNGNGTGESEVAWLSSGTKNCIFRHLKVKSFSTPASGRIGFFIDTASRTNNNENLTVEYCTFEGPCGGQDFLGTGCLIDSNINHNYFKNCTSQAIGVGKSLRTKYNDNTFNTTGNVIGLENDCQDNEIKDNVCYITSGIKLSEEGSTATNISRNNTVDGNIIAYGPGGIEDGIGINDTITNNILYRTSRNGIRGAFNGTLISNNHLIDTNFDNNSQTINGSSRTVGGIVCINNATPLPDCDNNIISNNKLQDTGVAFTDPVSTLSKNGNTGSIILDTDYNSCQLHWNTFCALMPSDVLDFGTNTVRCDADDDRVINLTTDQSIRLKGSTIRMGPNGRLRMTDTGLTVDRDYTFPDASGEVGVITATQTLTNKTVDTKSNTLIGVAQNPVYKRWGAYQPMAPSTVSGANVGRLEGILTNHVPTGPGTCTNTWDTTEGLLTNLVTTTTINQNAGLVSPTGSIGIIRREQATKMVYRGKLDTVAGGVSRLYFGVSSNNALAISDTIANADSLVLVGFKAGATNYEIYHNDGSGAHATTTVTGTIAKNTSFHTIEIEWTASGNVVVTFDGTAQTISTDIPATSTNLFFHCLAQNATAAIRTHSIVGVWLETL